MATSTFGRPLIFTEQRIDNLIALRGMDMNIVRCKKGQCILTEEALKDVKPVDWGETALGQRMNVLAKTLSDKPDSCQ